MRRGLASAAAGGRLQKRAAPAPRQLMSMQFCMVLLVLAPAATAGALTALDDLIPCEPREKADAFFSQCDTAFCAGWTELIKESYEDSTSNPSLSSGWNEKELTQTAAQGKLPVGQIAALLDSQFDPVTRSAALHHRCSTPTDTLLPTHCAPLQRRSRARAYHQGCTQLTRPPSPQIAAATHALSAKASSTKRPRQSAPTFAGQMSASGWARVEASS